MIASLQSLEFALLSASCTFTSAAYASSWLTSTTAASSVELSSGSLTVAFDASASTACAFLVWCTFLGRPRNPVLTNLGLPGPLVFSVLSISFDFSDASSWLSAESSSWSLSDSSSESSESSGSESLLG